MIADDEVLLAIGPARDRAVHFASEPIRTVCARRIQKRTGAPL